MPKYLFQGSYIGEGLKGLATEGGTGCRQGGAEIGYRQARLRPDVTRADNLALVVKGACSGGEDQRTQWGDGRVRIGSAFIQAVRTDQVNGQNKTLPIWGIPRPSACRPGNRRRTCWRSRTGPRGSR